MRLALCSAFVLATALTPQLAQACGGFFCSQTPVDQSAERVLFEVSQGVVRATVQITYAGAPEDFAWVLPTPGVPTVEDVFPQRALSGLDIATQPRYEGLWCAFPQETDSAAGGGDDGGDGGGGGGVIVHERKEVGPFDTAVIESDDPEALLRWLTDNGYRITEAMVPYISTYVVEGMVFVALKMKPDGETADIAPIIFSWEGDEPMIPLRLTAVAAEPEMSVVVWVLSDKRYKPGNFADIQVDDDDLLIDLDRIWSANPTNYHQHVAGLVDQANGMGFVTEFAGSTAPFIEIARNSPLPDEGAREAQTALIELLTRHTYITRMYTRLAPAEMLSDPTFRPGPDGGGDVSNVHDLSERFEDEEGACDPALIEGDGAAGVAGPCDLVACGAHGFCALDDQGRAGCACRGGYVARTVREGDRDATTCQSRALAFDNDAGVPQFNDPCAGFDCGEGGSCVNMNGTPTCNCDQGLIAIGEFAPMGEDPAMRQRKTWCVVAAEEVPAAWFASGEPGNSRGFDPDAIGDETGGETGDETGGGQDGPPETGGGQTPGTNLDGELISDEPSFGGGARSQGDGGLCAMTPGAAGGGLGLLPAFLTLFGLALLRRN